MSTDIPTEADAEAADALPITSTPVSLSQATVRAKDLADRGLTSYTSPASRIPVDQPDAEPAMMKTESHASMSAPPMPEVPAQSNLVEGLPPEPIAPPPVPPPTLRIPGIDPDPVQEAQAKYADARQRAAQSMVNVNAKFAQLGLPAPPDDALVDPGALHSHAQSFINRALASPQANQQSTFGPDRLTPQADQLRQNLKGLGDRAASAIGDHADALSDLRSSYAALQSAQQASRVAPPIPGVIEPSSGAANSVQGEPATGGGIPPHSTGAPGDSAKPAGATPQLSGLGDTLNRVVIGASHGFDKAIEGISRFVGLKGFADYLKNRTETQQAALEGKTVNAGGGGAEQFTDPNASTASKVVGGVGGGLLGSAPGIVLGGIPGLLTIGTQAMSGASAEAHDAAKAAGASDDEATKAAGIAALKTLPSTLLFAGAGGVTGKIVKNILPLEASPLTRAATSLVAGSGTNIAASVAGKAVVGDNPTPTLDDVVNGIIFAAHGSSTEHTRGTDLATARSIIDGSHPEMAIMNGLAEGAGGRVTAQQQAVAAQYANALRAVASKFIEKAGYEAPKAFTDGSSAPFEKPVTGREVGAEAAGATSSASSSVESEPPIPRATQRTVPPSPEAPARPDTEDQQSSTPSTPVQQPEQGQNEPAPVAPEIELAAREKELAALRPDAPPWQGDVIRGRIKMLQQIIEDQQTHEPNPTQVPTPIAQPESASAPAPSETQPGVSPSQIAPSPEGRVSLHLPGVDEPLSNVEAQPQEPVTNITPASSASEPNAETASHLGNAAASSAPLSKIAGPALIDEQGNILHRGELGQTHAQLKIAAAKNGVDATEATHAFHVEGSDKPLSRTEAAERALQTGQIDQATHDRAMSRTKDRGLHSQDLGAPPSEPTSPVEASGAATGGMATPAPVAEKLLRIPGLPEKPLTGEQARRVRALRLIATKRELRPAEQKELDTLDPQEEPPKASALPEHLRIPGLDAQQESLSKSSKPNDTAAPERHEPSTTADESARSEGRDHSPDGDAGGSGAGDGRKQGSIRRGGADAQRSIERVGKFVRRDGGHEAHLKRLGAVLRHVSKEAAPGGMAMTAKGELLHSHEAVQLRLKEIERPMWIPFGQTLFTEELIHRARALIEGKRTKVENAKVWAKVKRDPALAALVSDAYRSAKTDSQKGEEFMRMLVQKRQGFPVTESFYRDTRQLEAALAKQQDPAIEATAEKVGQVLLHRDAKEFPDASIPKEHPPAHGEVEESPTLNEILGGDEIYHGESPDSLVGKAVHEAVEHLSPEQRAVLDEIRKGKSVDQIAKAMGVQPATIKGRLSEANQALDKARDAAVSELSDHIRQYEPDPLHDLQARVRTLASTIGSKMGLARAMMRAATLGQQQGKAEHDFIDRQKTEIHKLATEIINDALPVSERSRFLDSLGRVLSTRIALRRGNETVVENLFKRAANIASNVLNRAEELRKEAVVQAIKKTATRVADSPSVDVVYKATIHDKIKNLEFHRPAARTVARLTGTKDYIEGKEQAAEGHAVPQEAIEELDRLNKLPIRDLPAHVLDHMLSDMLMLEKLGRLKVKTRAAVKDSRRQFALGEMAHAKTTPLNFNPIKVAQPGGKLTVPDAFRNKVNKAINRAAVIDRALLPMAAVADALGDGKGEYRGALERHVHGPIDTAYNSILVARDELLHPLEDLIAKHSLTEQDSQKFAVYATLQQSDGEHRLLEQGVTPETIAANRTLSPQLEEVYAAWQSIEKAVFPAVQKVARDEFNQHVAKVEHYFPMLRDHDAFVPTQAPIETAPGKAVQYDPMAMLQNLRDDFNPVPRKNAEAGFTKERVKGAGTPIRLDGFEVIRRHINDATHFIHMQPVLNDISAIVGNPVFVEKYGQGGQTIYRDYIDTIARQGGVDATKRVAWLDTLRRNLGLAAIGFRLASNIKHASNVGLAMYHAGPKWYAKGFKAAISGEANEWISKHMAEIKARHGAEPAQEEIETGKPVAQWAGKASVLAQKYAFYIARNIDAINARATALGAYMAELSAAGRDPENYLNEPVNRERVNRALLRMRRAVASPNPKDQPQALTRGTGLGDNASIAKTLLAFQNVFLDQWSNLRHDFARAGIKEKNPRIALMIGLAILATTLIETGIEHFVRQGENAVTGTPEDTKHPEEFAHSFLVNGLRRFPFMGQIMGAVRYGGSGVPVVDSLLVTPFKQVSKLSADNPTAQTKAKAAIDLAKTAGGLIGVPGIGYAGDMLKKVVPKLIPSKPTRTSVVDEVRQGDPAAIQKALQSGTIKPDQVRAIQRDAHMTPFQAKIRHLPLDKAEALYKSASDEQKKEAEVIMREKRSKRSLFVPHTTAAAV